MDIVDLLVPGAVLPSLKAQSKKHLLQEMSARAASLTGLPERRIFETLVERERLGSSRMGEGVAIPHGRLAGRAHPDRAEPGARPHRRPVRPAGDDHRL